MSQDVDVLDITFKAGENLLEKQHNFVRPDGSGGVIASANVIGAIETVEVGNSGGTGYEIDEELTITQNGASGGKVKVETAEEVGEILTVALGATGAGGTGYKVGEILTITQAGGENGKVKVLAVDEGVITEIALLTGGIGYTIADNLPTTSDGDGVDATMNISVVGLGVVLTVALSAPGEGYSVADDLATTSDGAGTLATISILSTVPIRLYIGILQNFPDIGKPARVRMLGTSKLVMSEICDVLAEIKSVAGEGAVAAADEDWIGAIALEEATDAGNINIIEVLITHFYHAGE